MIPILDPDKLNIVEQKRDYQIDTIHFNNEIPEMDEEEYDLFDDKDNKKFIDDIKKDVRGSREYKKLIQYLRKYMNMNKCSFYENVNNIETTKIRIEIHHTPFGLHDICKIVLNKRIFYHESITVEDVAEEVTMLHYSGMVGLIPLSETVHELVHNFYLFVPVSAVMGRYEDFVDSYSQFFEPEHEEIYNRILEYSRIYDFHTNSNILERKYTHIDISGAYKLPKLNDVLELVSNRVLEIRKGYNIPIEKQLKEKPKKPLVRFINEEELK